MVDAEALLTGAVLAAAPIRAAMDRAMRDAAVYGSSMLIFAGPRMMAEIERERAGLAAELVARRRGADRRRVKRERNKAMRAIKLPPPDPIPQINREKPSWWQPPVYYTNKTVTQGLVLRHRDADNLARNPPLARPVCPDLSVV